MFELGSVWQVSRGQGTDQVITMPEDDLNGKRLRILCLHGFRQTGSSLCGRTASLARRLKRKAELIFVDAPFPLRPMRKKTGEGASLKILMQATCSQKAHGALINALANVLQCWMGRNYF